MEPVKLGAKFYCAEPNGGPREIIKPADNVAGIIIQTGLFAGPVRSVISSGTSAPTGTSDYTKPVLMAMTAPAVPHQLQYPIHLPAGFGLWSFSNEGSVRVCITYDVL